MCIRDRNIILSLLIIAVLLIVLGLTIVVNSAKSYVKSKKGSETEEVAKA